MEDDEKQDEIVHLNLADLDIEELDARLEMVKMHPNGWACGANACVKN